MNSTIEGAPELREEYLSMFDCAFRPSKGIRSINWSGHIDMMAAVQPFLSGAISKTVNLPSEATVSDVEGAYLSAWRKGLKAVAIYRDGPKTSQPVSASAPAVEARVASASPADRSGPPAANRHRLQDERSAINHHFSNAGHEGYLTVGLYPNGHPGEISVRMAKAGSTIAGLMECFGTVVYRCGHAGFERAVGVVDAYFNSEDLVLTVVAGLYVAGEELCLGSDFLHVSGEGTTPKGVDFDTCRLADADGCEVCLGDIDLDPKLRRLEHGDDDLAGTDEIAGTHADCLDQSVGRGEKVSLFQLNVELVDACLRLLHLRVARVDVFFAIAALHEVGRGLRLVVALLSDLDVFFAGTCLQKSEALAKGLGLLSSRIARCFCVVVLLAGDSVAAYKCVHSLEVDLGVRCIDFGAGLVCLCLPQLL